MLRMIQIIPASVAFAIALAVGSAQAQNMPSSQLREVMIKATLMTFNDANLSNNYTVLNALASKPFREQLPPEKLSEAFAAFRDQKIDISAIVSFPPIEDPSPVIDADGYLQLHGYFDTAPSQVAYQLSFYGDDDGAWRLIAVNVNVAPPEDKPAN